MACSPARARTKGQGVLVFRAPPREAENNRHDTYHCPQAAIAGCLYLQHQPDVTASSRASLKPWTSGLDAQRTGTMSALENSAVATNNPLSGSAGTKACTTLTLPLGIAAKGG